MGAATALSREFTEITIFIKDDQRINKDDAIKFCAWLEYAI